MEEKENFFESVWNFFNSSIKPCKVVSNFLKDRIALDGQPMLELKSRTLVNSYIISMNLFLFMYISNK